MKHQRKVVNLEGRLFTQALQSAIGTTGPLSQKDQTASKENRQVAEKKTAIDLSKMAPGNVNHNAIASDVVKTDSSLQTKKALKPQPSVEKNHISTDKEIWDGNLRLPTDQTTFSTYRPALQETNFAEDISHRLDSPNHLDINANEYELAHTNLGSSPLWITDPCDLKNWLHNYDTTAFQITLYTVPQNKVEEWIQENRLLALQQMGSNTLDQYSAIESTRKMFPDKVHNLPECLDSPTVLSSMSTNSSKSDCLKDMPVHDGKYKCDRPSSHQEENMVSEWSKDMKKLKDQKFTQENSKEFPSKENATCLKSNGRVEKNIRLAARSSHYDVDSLMALESEAGFYDSHCYLDFLLNRQKFCGSYGDFMADHKDSYPKSYKGCIAVFCNPLRFAKEELWKKHLNEANVWGAFGCHPKSAEDYNDEVEVHLEAALNHPKVKALGVIGLDYSERFKNTKSKQKEVFRRQLKIAHRRKLPLVIHCRDADDDIIKIMHEILPNDTVFHLQCFTGNWEKARKWLREFPNVFIGLSNLVTFLSAGPIHEVARKLSLDYLLLETDAPYFVPSKVPRSTKFSHPGMAIYVAARVAELKGVDIETVLRATSANTRCVYNLPREKTFPKCVISSPRMLA